MSTTSTQTAAPDEPTVHRRPSRRRKAWVVAAFTLTVGVGGVVAVATSLGADSGNLGGGDVVGNGAATSLATVEQQTLTAQIPVNGTLGYAGDYSVVAGAGGTFTALPSVGAVVNQGDVLYRVNGAPVVLLYGATPAYRDLAAGASEADVTGPDVQQLNAALVALGYASGDNLDPSSDQFSWRTTQAVKKLQEALGVEQTGALTLGQVVFLPSAARVTSVAGILGAPAQPGATVLEVTSTTHVVSIALAAARQSQVAVGDTVSVTLPDNTTAAGVVSSVSSVASAPDDGGGGGGDSSSTIAVEVTLTDPAAGGSWDQAPVLVSITTATVENALVVPVAALLSLAGGGYAVEVVDDDRTRHLVPVALGLFDDAQGLVEISESNLAVGQQVVVPSS